MVKIIWTELALEDLKSIHNYIAEDSEAYANRFVEKILTRVKQLESFPRSGRTVPEFGVETIRELIDGDYRIVYNINENSVFIVRIQHSSMLLRNIK